jgi:hypothetical protein
MTRRTKKTKMVSGTSGKSETSRMSGVDASYTLLSLLCIEIWCRTFIDGVCSVSAQ